MLRFSFKFLFVLLPLSALGSTSQAQWQRVTGPAFLSMNAREGCAINFSDGIVWAGGNSLWRSSDLGLTWSKIYFPGTPTTIAAIAFFDRLHGVVIAGSTPYSAYVTSDGCASWQLLPSIVKRWVAYGMTADTIYYSSGGAIEININGTIARQQPVADAIDPIVARNGTVYYMNNSSIVVSDGAGSTWQARGTLQLDCNQLSLDSCDASTVYAVNEKIQQFGLIDTVTSIFVSRDNGWTWTSQNPHGIDYYCGNIATSKAAVYTQTQDGIIRSTDHGITWTTIGGPTGPPDNQSLSVVADSILLVIDSFGNMWRTSNDGEFPVTRIVSVPVLLNTDTLFADDTVSLCRDTVMRSIAVARTCGAVSLLSVQRGGGDSSAYQIAAVHTSGEPAIDSIYIRYIPSVAGKDSGSLLLHYSGDTTLSVPLSGFCIPRGAPRLFASSDTIFKRDSVFPCGGPAIEGLRIDRICDSRQIQSIHVTGANSTNYVVDTSFFVESLGSDSIIIRFSSDDSILAHGMLQVVYDDGSTVSIPLAGIGRKALQPRLLPLPDTMFARDTLSPCDAPVFQHFFIDRACALRQIRSLAISGPNSANYTIDTLVYDTIKDLDSIALHFLTNQAGASIGSLLVTYDDGSSVTIPLRGEGLPAPIVSLSTLDVTMGDTIGGAVRVPIIIQHNHALKTIDFRIRFDTSIMEFDSVVWSDGTWVSGSYATGLNSAHIHVAARNGDNPDTVYALFRWYPNVQGQDTVYFDSVQVTPAACLILSESAIASHISGPVFCVSSMLTTYLHYGQMPLLSIRPNPASDRMEIETKGVLDADASISVWDALGRRIDFQANEKLIDVSSLAQGVYFVELHTGRLRISRMLVIHR
ncbi:MAG: T9SS type A sorting domain-containing protein [Bacteroidota bacterium]|nr:T9SS type A sorting domain-containing protein [Bacteroidota bacterium]MDP4234178.1 T9SS type A sorting domain-containing protein [Bacteroidota bacterium]MDP4243756.1 T9SS type A sorting domain-containing protein [Bacteroidota bacterium]MDP4287879.1 T9SS type A sorting domain-containing protein [Bacteroidota bacterium]